MRAARGAAFALVLLALAPPVAAQQDDAGQSGYFEDHTALRDFIDARMAEGEIGALYERLSTSPVATGEITRVETAFAQLYDSPFENSGFLWSTASPDGFREDILVFWNAEDVYVYMLLVTHQRAENLIVLDWRWETSYAAIMEAR